MRPFDVFLLGGLTWLLYVSAKTPIALAETCLLLIVQHTQHLAASKGHTQIHESSTTSNSEKKRLVDSANSTSNTPPKTDVSA